MRIFITLALFFILLTTSFAQGTYDQREKGQLIIMLKNDANPVADASLRADFQSLGITIDHKIAHTFNIWLFSFDENKYAAGKLLQSVKSHPLVKLAQFNHKVSERELIPNDPSFNQQWAFKNTGQSGGAVGADIKATEAWGITTSGTTVLGDTIVIAVVDGGVDLNHSDLNLKKNWNEIPGNGIDDDNNGYTDDFDGWNAYSNTGNMVPHDHGTHVAGIAAAKTNNATGVAGVSFNAKVLPVAGSGSNEVLVVSAYDYVYTMRKLYNETDGQLGAFIVASNSSFGIDGGDPADYPVWSAMYDSMGLVGIINVASTANKGWDVDVNGDIPTAMTNESIIAVTNTTRLDLKNTQAAWGYNSIDLGAPGTDIYSTRQGNLYGNKTGTSMSSPMVSGSIALLYAATDSARLYEYREFPSLAVSRFKRYILSTVDTIPTLVGLTVSGGRLNLRNAVLMASNPPMLTATPGAVNIKLRPNALDTITVQVFSSSTEPDPFTVSLSPDSQWLSVDTTEGIFIPGSPQTIKVIINTNGMAVGSYTTSFSINDYFLNQLVIPANVEVDTTISRSEVVIRPSVTLNPNPFDESLKINISLLYSSPVSVKIINMQGIVVADFATVQLPAGMSILEWDGKSTNNQNVAPGVYFIVVTDKFGSVTSKSLKK
ncbi:MAG: S8 family peptidase [Omnitrophica WOR_2 bacterium]